MDMDDFLEDEEDDILTEPDVCEGRDHKITTTFFKDVPMSPSQSWDFSLQSLDPDYRSKCIWLEGPFYQKMHDECLHEMHYLQCPCDERKRTPVCRLCNMPFCSTGCFKQTSRAQMGIKSKQTDTEEGSLSPSYLGTEHESRAQPPINEGKNLKPSWNRKQSSTQGDDYNSSVARGKSSYTENRMDMEVQGGSRKFQNHRYNQRDQFRGGDSGDTPQHRHQQQLHNGYNNNNHGPRATLNKVAPEQIDKSRRLLPLPPGSASTTLIPTGIVSPYQQTIFQHPDHNHFAAPTETRDYYPAPVKILRNPKPCMHHQQNISPEKTDGVPHNSSVSTNNSGPSVPKQQPGSNSRRYATSGSDRQQNNGFNKSQTNLNFRQRTQDTVTEVEVRVRENRPGDSLANRQREHVKKGVHFQDTTMDSSAPAKDKEIQHVTSRNTGGTFVHSNQREYEDEPNDTSLVKNRSGTPSSAVARVGSFNSASRKSTLTTTSATFQAPPSRDEEVNGELEPIKTEQDFPHGIPIQVKHIQGKSFYDFAGIPIGNEATAMQIGSILQTCPKDRMEVFEYNDYCIVNAPSETGNGGEWYRAIITKIVGKVGVYLLDLGVSTIVDAKAIYKLPTELWNYRPLAIRVKCLNIKADMNDPDVCDYFSSLVEDRTVKVKITHKVPWESFMYAGYLEVMHISKWFDVGTLLEKFQVAESVSESENTEGLQKLQEVESTSENTISCSADGTFQATVSYVVSVNEFYVSTKKSIKRRFKIEQKLNNPSILSKCKRIATLKDLACPLFTLVDEMQVRVKVMEVEGPETVIVQKIDYGDILTVRIADLKKLPTYLHEPSCIFKCSLPVKPVPKSRRSDSAQPMAYDDLTSILVKLCDQPVVLFVYSIENSNTHIVELALEINSTGCTYSFVKKGWVALSHDVDLNCMNKSDN